MESNRQKKIGRLIQEELADIFIKQSKNSTGFLITVSDVKVTVDLSIAKVYVSIFPEQYREPLMSEIDNLNSHFRNLLGQKLSKTLRQIPKLNFYLDNSLDRVEEIERELRGLGDNPLKK